jgi:hypothetical protein
MNKGFLILIPVNGILSKRDCLRDRGQDCPDSVDGACETRGVRSVAPESPNLDNQFVATLLVLRLLEINGQTVQRPDEDPEKLYGSSAAADFFGSPDAVFIAKRRATCNAIPDRFAQSTDIKMQSCGNRTGHRFQS